MKKEKDLEQKVELEGLSTAAAIRRCENEIKHIEGKIRFRGETLKKIKAELLEYKGTIAALTAEIERLTTKQTEDQNGSNQ